MAKVSWLLEQTNNLGGIIVELLLDYVFKISFRNTPSYVIPYVMLFLAGTGWMIGIVANAGREWSITAGVFFR